MNSFLSQNKIKAFLPHSKPELNEYRKQLIGVLQSANIEVIENPDQLENTQCSIHILGCQYSDDNNDLGISDDEFWFKKAYNLINTNKLFRIFVWQPPFLQNQINSLKQNAFINSIRNNLVQNMTFSNHHSPVMLVEDIRSIIYTEQKAIFDTNPTDVFFIYNEIDEDLGDSIVELLNDVVKIEKLNISLNLGTDYSELISQQIQKSQLTAIYFNRTANWAVPFTKQVWKNIGGASANKKILMIGDSGYEQNQNILFEAPNVTNISTSTELIPLETKVFYDNLFLK
jgi:hypothetical protein